MWKKFGIASVISLILIIVIVSIAIMTGAFNYVRHTNTVIDETNQTLQVVISDGVKEHPAYNENLPDIYLPNIPKQNYSLPVMNSDTYFTFKVWGGTKTEDKTYGFASVYDYSYMESNGRSFDDVILYKEKPKGWIQKPLKPINELSKVLGYKVNIQKYFAFLNTNNEFSESKKKIHLKIT